jgi:hypothetical protein
MTLPLPSTTAGSSQKIQNFLVQLGRNGWSALKDLFRWAWKAFDCIAMACYPQTTPPIRLTAEQLVEPTTFERVVTQVAPQSMQDWLDIAPPRPKGIVEQIIRHQAPDNRGSASPEESRLRSQKTVTISGPLTIPGIGTISAKTVKNISRVAQFSLWSLLAMNFIGGAGVAGQDLTALYVNSAILDPKDDDQSGRTNLLYHVVMRAAYWGIAANTLPMHLAFAALTLPPLQNAILSTKSGQKLVLVSKKINYGLRSILYQAAEFHINRRRKGMALADKINKNLSPDSLVLVPVAAEATALVNTTIQWIESGVSVLTYGALVGAHIAGISALKNLGSFCPGARHLEIMDMGANRGDNIGLAIGATVLMASSGTNPTIAKTVGLALGSAVYLKTGNAGRALGVVVLVAAFNWCMRYRSRSKSLLPDQFISEEEQLRALARLSTDETASTPEGETSAELSSGSAEEPDYSVPGTPDLQAEARQSRRSKQRLKSGAVQTASRALIALQFMISIPRAPS